MNTESVDSYLRDGCGRCDDYRTPACKVHRWTAVLARMREVLRASGLVEEMKWGSPCYTVDGRNVAMLVAFRESCALSFFKGVALDDPDGVLQSAGPNARYARVLRFRSLDEAEALRPHAVRLVAQAIAVERAGTKVAPAATLEAMPEELAARLEADPALRAAFDALTHGRRRSHVLHIAGAKQGDTRARRVERCAPDILAGRGFNER